MNKAIFHSMREQMTPSATAQEALAARLWEAAPARRGHTGRHIAAAACAALLLCVYPVYQTLAPKSPVLHSYVTVEEGTMTSESTKQMAGDIEEADEGSGDRDQAMTSEELFEAMEEVGFSTADIDAYQTLGYQMTWAKWWKFVGQQRESEGEEPFNLADLETFSREELAVNPGDLPGGATIGEAPSQLGADAYQLLMDHFNGTLPDWYGGAYVDKSGALMVLLVRDKDPGDKSLELEVMGAVGKEFPVGFTDAKYSRNDLNRLNREFGTLLEGNGLFANWGIYDDRNCIILDLFETPSDDLLAALAQLDPEGDAIQVRVVTGGTTVTQEERKGPAPVDTVGDEDDGFDVVHTLPGGTPAEDDSDLDLEANEPDAEELPQSKYPGVEQAQPAQTGNAE